MRRLIALTVSILFAFSIPRPGIAQIRINRPARDVRGSRKSYEYDEQNSGAFPSRVPHFLIRSKVHSVRKKRAPAKEIDNEFYIGYSLSIDQAPFYQNRNTQLSFTYLQNNTSSVYQGNFNASNISKCYQEFNGGIEVGQTKGLFYAMTFGGTANTPNIFNWNLVVGKHFITHNNRWQFSPAVSLGFISSNVSFPQTIDNSMNVNILGASFPHMSSTSSSVTYSDKITMFMFNRSAYIKVQTTLSPRIKNGFPLRVTVGYRSTLTKDLEIDIKSPTASSSFSWKTAGLNFSSGNGSPGNSLSYNGVFFELAWFFKSHKYKQF